MKRIPLRWWIGTALFLSTTINYIDRQTLSVLAPHIKTEFGWNNETFAILIIAFRVAYTIGQTACGRVLDLMGVRRGLSLTVAFYSAAAMLTSLATGIRSFSAFRFLLGAGESANWPGAAKTVSQYFPPRARLGGGLVRQRIGRGGSRGALPRLFRLSLVRQLASGVRAYGSPWIPLDSAVSQTDQRSSTYASGC